MVRISTVSTRVCNCALLWPEV